MFRYGSVCSGIEAATVAWHELGWQPAWFSEIEKFPSAVLAYHYSTVPNYGDMTQHQEWPNESINLLVGGTPCQSFSVAGLRKGLDDPRGNLMLTYGAIARQFRPEWLVWENVPGVLSSNKGRDFGTFFRMLAECGYGFAYRILDAQYFGVAQRRRRVFVVANARSWQRAAAVLFESHSLQGHPPPSREKGQGVAGAAVQCFDRQSSGEYGTNPIASTVSARDFKSAADLVAQPVTQFGDVAGSFTARHDSSPCADRGQNVLAQPVAFSRNDDGRDATDNLAPTMRVAGRAGGMLGIATAMQVRRLTPVECERLQGFPDGYTNIPWRNKPESPDGPRYKALGNSMAVPVMKWIGERIKKVEEL